MSFIRSETVNGNASFIYSVIIECEAVVHEDHLFRAQMFDRAMVLQWYFLIIQSFAVDLKPVRKYAGVEQ